jgi:hypothetical protein
VQARAPLSARCGSRGCSFDKLRSNRWRRQFFERPRRSKNWGCSSVGRAPALQAGGHRFDSVHLHHRPTRSVVSRAAAALLSLSKGAPRERGAGKADRRKKCFAGSLRAAGVVIFDRVKREYLSSMMAKVDKATSVVRPLSSVVCSGEDSSFWLTACELTAESSKRVSSCETRLLAGLVPASDGFSDQALR